MISKSANGKPILEGVSQPYGVRNEGLTGEVAWNYQRGAAEQDVQRLHGVVGVLSDISIKPSVNTANISKDISAALHRSWFSARDAIIVTAKDGRVRLTGNVHSWYARQVTGETAWNAPGAIDV